MKNLFLAVAIAATGFTVNAQEDKEVAVTTAETTAVMAVEAGATDELQKDYRKIQVSEVPAPVVQALNRDHRGSTITEAFVNDRNEYKLVVRMEGKTETKTKFATQTGEWIKKDKKDKKDKK